MTGWRDWKRVVDRISRLRPLDARQLVLAGVFNLFVPDDAGANRGIGFMFGGDDMDDNEVRLTAPFPTAVESPKTPTCANCRWWVRARHGGPIGDCRVKHPSIKGFPRAQFDEFCGEFKAK